MLLIKRQSETNCNVRFSVKWKVIFSHTRARAHTHMHTHTRTHARTHTHAHTHAHTHTCTCLLYTSDAADE